MLILDQFEDFFAFHTPEERATFIRQLADLGKESAASRDTAPHVKILISIREDYLGLLEEMTQDLPGVLQNRFRVLPLKREQAKQAIIEPAQLKGCQIQSRIFHYAPDTLEAMLDFLCKRRKRREFTSTSEDTPFIKKGITFVRKIIGGTLGYPSVRPQKYAMSVAGEVEPF